METSWRVSFDGFGKDAPLQQHGYFLGSRDSTVCMLRECVYCI